MLLATFVLGAETGAQSEPERAAAAPHRVALAAIRTESPRRTLETFLALRGEIEEALAAYRADRSHGNFASLVDAAHRIAALFDTSTLPEATRREAALDTSVAMLDVYDRLAPPDPGLAPDESGAGAPYVLPGTPFRIVRIADGPRIGEFLFAPDTVTAAPRLLRRLDGVPRQVSRPFDSWTAEIASVTGPLLPVALEDAFPGWGSRLVLDTPLRKHVLLFCVLAALAGAAVALHRLLRARAGEGSLASPLRLLVTPVAVIAAVVLLEPAIDLQLNTFGRLDALLEAAAIAVLHLAGAWLAWLLCVVIAELAIRRRDVKEQSLDASLLRLIARIAGLVAAVIVAAFGMQRLGLPAFSLLAGLGIGGLAVALAIRPSLENLIGGFILYLDKPARVGDFCQVGTLIGSIERIGVRSTKLRALDRTLITIPNAQFADMQIVNWARCDQMLIEERIGLRHETTPDQLRWVLAKIRMMFHAHPRIDTRTVRVRFAGYGGSELKIDIRVYAATREWNDFFAIREDVMLRVGEIVAKSGSGFAFPSRTVYAATDPGVDAARGERVARQVARWRQTGQLPFPRFAPEDIERVSDRLAYPPYGSPHFSAGSISEEELWDTAAEPLSTEAGLEDPPQEDGGNRAAPPSAGGAGKRPE